MSIKPASKHGYEVMCVGQKGLEEIRFYANVTVEGKEPRTTSDKV